MTRILMSIMSPVYCGEKMMHTLVERIVKNVSTIMEGFEIILVNDASTDSSWLVIQKECVPDNRVKGLDLSRNFDQHYAITVGLSYSQGNLTSLSFGWRISPFYTQGADFPRIVMC